MLDPSIAKKLNCKNMHKGFALILVLGLTLVAAGIGGYTIFNDSGLLVPAEGTQPSSSPQTTETSKVNKTTKPNNTGNWIYFASELYRYSLKYPNNFNIIVGNKNIFQASSQNYLEENGVVTTGAITQVIASDSSETFEDAWGDIESKLKNLDIKILSKENTLVDGQKAYKLKLGHSDNTIEIRYLTYKSPYSYKISIVVGKNARAQMDDYEQILDDIISTFNF